MTKLGEPEDGSPALSPDANWKTNTLIVKRAFDIVLSIFLLITFSWLFLAIWICVKRDSEGPAFYSQARYGKNGRVFRFYKFRSMAVDGELLLKRHLQENAAAREEWRVFQKLQNDPRITRLGLLIRKYSLDEIPQIWNVLRGDMSVVGPRPCTFSQRNLYAEYWHIYSAVRPGITGLWQVSGRNKVSYRRRAAMDAEYVRHLSLYADLRILLMTVRVVFNASGSR
jgi:exopolysaccharide production protein ExoY